MGVAIDATPVPPRSSALLIGLVLLVVTVVAWTAGAPYVVGVFHDDGGYALLAKSIASGHGFRYLGLPGSPQAVHQPPLYPLLLAAVWRVAPRFPDNVSALLALNAVLLGIAAAGLYQFALARLQWRREAAVLIAILATIVSPMLVLSSATLSEPLFLAALWPVLLVSERAAERPDLRAVVVAGICIGALMLVRTHAIALLGALVLIMLLRRRAPHAAVATGVALLVLLPWQLWTHFATPVPAPLEGAYGSYLGWYVTGLREGGVSFVLATARVNVHEFWLLLMDRVAVGSRAWVQVTAASILVALMLIGAWRAHRRAPITTWFLAAYLGIVLVWPYVPWRFVWAVLPVLLLLAAEGARELTVPTRPMLFRAAAAALVAVPAMAMLVTERNAYASRAWTQPTLRAGEQVKPVVQWVAAMTQPTDVVLTEGADVVTLFTGRRAAPPASFTAREYLVPQDSATSRKQLEAMLRAVPARYVIGMQLQTREAARALGLRELGTLTEANAVVFEVVR